jgi:hypothetical protein
LSAHTPEPWRYVADDGEIRADDDRCCVATIEILDDSGANGSLIAAAPDLLAAGEKAARVLDSAAIALAGTPAYRALVKRCADTATELRTAIVKARGQ